MSLKKRFIAGCLAVSMVFSLAGCSNKTGYIMKADGEEIQSGVYISLMLTEYTNQIYKLYYSGQGLADSFDAQKVDGKPMGEYLENYAYETCLDIVAVEKKCKELGIKLTDDEKKEVNSAVNNAWDTDGDYYEEMGISKESLKRIQTYSKLSEKLFEGLYFENGIEAVKNEEIDQYVKDNLLRYKQIYIRIDEKDKDKSKNLSEKYMKLAEEGKTMDELIEMYKEETKTSSDSDKDNDKDDSSKDDSSTNDSSSNTDSSSKDDSSTNDSSSDTDSSSEDDSSTNDSSSDTNSSSKDDSSTNDSSSNTDSSSKDDSSTNDSSSDKDSSSKDDSSSSTDDKEDEEDDKDKTPAEIESEKYPNEYVRDKSSFTDNKYIDFIAGLEYGKISMYTDEEDGYYIVERLDMSERTEFAQANKESLIKAMRSDAYEKLVDEVANGISIEKNTKSFEKYKAKDVYERQNKWYDKKK